MLNFKDFSKKQKEESSEINFSQNDVNKAKSVIEKYSGYNEDELSQILANEIVKSKASGNFDKQKVLKQISSISAFLTPEQQKKMRDIIDKY